MKYPAIIIAALLALSAKAGALSWDEAIAMPLDSIQNSPSSVPEPAAPARAVEQPAVPLNIPPAEAKTYLENEKPFLIDIRTPEEYAAGHLENSVEMDYYATDFKDKLSKLDKSAKYLIYCRSGKRSAAALKIMQDMGFSDVHDIAGGITAWIAAGLPVVK